MIHVFYSKEYDYDNYTQFKVEAVLQGPAEEDEQGPSYISNLRREYLALHPKKAPAAISSLVPQPQHGTKAWYLWMANGGVELQQKIEDDYKLLVAEFHEKYGTTFDQYLFKHKGYISMNFQDHED